MPLPSTAEARLCEVAWEALAEAPGRAAPALDAALAEVLAGAAAERVLDRFLRAHRTLSRQGRAAAAEAVFGVGLWRRRLRAQLGRPESSPRELLAVLVRDLGGRPGAEALLGLPAGALPAPLPPPESLADRLSWPDWLAEELARAAGEEAFALADALGRPGPVFFRANTLRITPPALAARLAWEGVPTRAARFAPHGLVALDARPNVYGLPAFREGLFEVQDEGSQLVGAAVEARPGDAVLDACAGPGGKTLLLAAAVAPGGVVHATDPDPERLERLRVRAERAGAAPLVRVRGPSLPAGAAVDRALVDAPCSELGTLRRGPDLRWRLDPAHFAALPALQLDILSRAARHVRRGGRLVYATCTFRREEDEDVALAFEAAHPAFRRAVPALDPALLTAEGFVRTWPHLHGTDAFFAAAWTHTGA